MTSCCFSSQSFSRSGSAQSSMDVCLPRGGSFLAFSPPCMVFLKALVDNHIVSPLKSTPFCVLRVNYLQLTPNEFFFGVVWRVGCVCASRFSKSLFQPFSFSRSTSHGVSLLCICKNVTRDIVWNTIWSMYGPHFFMHNSYSTIPVVFAYNTPPKV